MTADQIWSGVMLYGWDRKRFERELEILCKQQRELCAEVAHAKNIQETPFGPLHVQVSKDSIINAESPV